MRQAQRKDPLGLHSKSVVEVALLALAIELNTEGITSQLYILIVVVDLAESFIGTSPYSGGKIDHVQATANCEPRS